MISRSPVWSYVPGSKRGGAGSKQSLRRLAPPLSISFWSFCMWSVNPRKVVPFASLSHAVRVQTAKLYCFFLFFLLFFLSFSGLVIVNSTISRREEEEHKCTSIVSTAAVKEGLQSELIIKNDPKGKCGGSFGMATYSGCMCGHLCSCSTADVWAHSSSSRLSMLLFRVEASDTLRKSLLRRWLLLRHFSSIPAISWL